MELKKREIIEQHGVEELRPGALYLTYANRDGVESVKIHDGLPGVGLAIRIDRKDIRLLVAKLTALANQLNVSTFVKTHLGGPNWDSSE